MTALPNEQPLFSSAIRIRTTTTFLLQQPTPCYAVLRALLLLLLISTLSGCFPPANIGHELEYGAVPPMNEAAVFGGIRVVDSYTTGSTKSGFWSRLLVKNLDSPGAWPFYVFGEEAAFAWHLQPGDFLIVRLELGWVEGNPLFAHTERQRNYPILARFSVQPGESAVYIGDLLVSLNGGTGKVVDEYEKSKGSVCYADSARGTQPARRLMQLEVSE